jgi:hypothetical protein
MGRNELVSSGSGSVPVAGSCEHEREPLDSVKGGEFLDQLALQEHCSLELIR